MGRIIKDKVFDLTLDKIKYYLKILEEFQGEGIKGFMQGTAIKFEKRKIKKLIKELEESGYN